VLHLLPVPEPRHRHGSPSADGRLPALAAVLPCIPFALAEQLQASAGEYEVDRAATPDSMRLATGKVKPSAGQRRVVGHRQLQPEQAKHARAERLVLT
jgi:hypothetical protein